MILVAAVVLGLGVGLARAGMGKRPYQTFEIKLGWLVFIAFGLQLIVFILPATRKLFPDPWAPFALVTTNIVLLVFVWVNRRRAGFWLLGLGLLLNFTVIALNGGLMPISPETVHKMYPAEDGLWQMGERLGKGKDIVLPAPETRLWLLSDRFVVTYWQPNKVAFSAGDVLIAAGTLWLLWSLGGPLEAKHNQEVKV